MKEYCIEYMSYEGNLRTTTAEGEDEDDAVSNAINEDSGWGDGIQKIISVEEC